YRSGDYTRAAQAFREVANTPDMAALAYYNLGLIELQRGNQTAARQWFERAGALARDERLAALVAQRLGELPGKRVANPWSWFLRSGAGYDDNVALRSESVDTTASGKDDFFGELLVSGNYTFGPAWRVDAAASLLRFQSLDDFDQGAFSIG